MAEQPLLPKYATHQSVWYLAYGSNLSAKTFEDERHMRPQAAVAVEVPGWTLTMSSAGFPYREPAFASIQETTSDGEKSGPRQSPSLCGTAYLISWQQWVQIIASEGGGVAYREIVIGARPLRDAERQQWGTTIRARSLVSTMERPEARPSVRYLGLILDGAHAAEFPAEYIAQLRQRFPCYKPPSTLWARVGAALFLAFWTPILALLSYITHATARTGPGDDGHVPELVCTIVRLAMWSMWLVHDAFWAKIWGRGDGLEDDSLDYREIKI